MGTGALRGSWQGDFDCASLRFPCPWQEKVVPRPFCQTIISQGFFPKWHISPHKGRAFFVFCQQCEESAKNLSLLFIHIWILAFFLTPSTTTAHLWGETVVRTWGKIDIFVSGCESDRKLIHIPIHLSWVIWRVKIWLITGRLGDVMSPNKVRKFRKLHKRLLQISPLAVYLLPLPPFPVHLPGDEGNNSLCSSQIHRGGEKTKEW